MDAMQLLRSYRDDAPEVDGARLDAVRARLEQRMTAGPATVRRAPVRPILLGALGAVAATAVVVTLVTAGPAPQASAEAARILDTAASSARGQVTSGGHRTIVLRSEGLSEQVDGDGDVVAAYNTRTVATVEVPLDGGTWVRRSYPLAPDAYYGGAAARRLATHEGAYSSSYSKAHPQVERSVNGTFTNGELGGGSMFGDDPGVLRALPRDPSALLAALREADLGVEDRGRAAHVLQAASIVLRSGVADGGLQAAVFQALRLQPGVAVADRSVDVDGRAAVAIGEARPSWKYEADELLLDPSTGAYLGDRSVALLDQGVIPAGAVVSSTTITRR